MPKRLSNTAKGASTGAKVGGAVGKGVGRVAGFSKGIKAVDKVSKSGMSGKIKFKKI